MWQITFIGNPATLPELEHLLRIDERVLRHIFVKKEPYKALPTTYSVKKEGNTDIEVYRWLTASGLRVPMLDSRTAKPIGKVRPCKTRYGPTTYHQSRCR